MTETPKGITFTNYKWETLRGEAEHLGVHFHDALKHECIETPNIIPNGMWVLEVPKWRPYGKFVGLQPEGEVRYANRDGTEYVVYYDTVPFGLITPNRGGFVLTSARQVHRGELGQAVRIPSVNYVREPIKDGKSPNVIKARERRRGHYEWLKLGDLAEMAGAGYNPDKWLQLVLDYWDFSLMREGYPKTEIVQRFAWGTSLDIRTGDFAQEVMTREVFERENDPSELWVTGGLAKTILRLQALGYSPQVRQIA